MTNDLEFGLAVMTRIIKKAGADRVSEDAANQLRIILEEVAMEIAKSAIILSHHAGRKTVKNEDISLAFKTSIKFHKSE